MRSRFLLHRAARILTLSMLVAGISGFGACAPSLKNVCTRELPRFERELTQASQELAAYAPAGAVRAIASKQDVPEGEPRRWKAWAELRLGDLRRLLSAAEEANVSETRLMSVHRISNDLVVFWGHVDSQRFAAASRTLEGVLPRLETVRSEFCR